jgi:mRNA deadenylase 3'-5' endonuclease subunit Ccr4
MSRIDMTTPPSKMSQAPSQATPTQVSPTPTPAQVIDGPITRSRAKKLQQEVHALLCEIHFNINENYILPKCCTLIVLRYIEEEKDESDPEERTSASSRRSQKRTSGSQKRTSARNLHNFLLTKAMKVHEHLLESLTSLLSNESSGDQFGYSILPADQN